MNTKTQMKALAAYIIQEAERDLSEHIRDNEAVFYLRDAIDTDSNYRVKCAPYKDDVLEMAARINKHAGQREGYGKPSFNINKGNTPKVALEQLIRDDDIYNACVFAHMTNQQVYVWNYKERADKSIERLDLAIVVSDFKHHPDFIVTKAPHETRYSVLHKECLGNLGGIYTNKDTCICNAQKTMEKNGDKFNDFLAQRIKDNSQRNHSLILTRYFKQMNWPYPQEAEIKITLPKPEFSIPPHLIMQAVNYVRDEYRR